MSDTPRRLLRQQLAKFVPDPRTLRAMEQLISVVDTIAPTVIDEVSTAAASAEATAVQALGQVADTAQSAAVLAGSAENKAVNALQSLEGIAKDAAINAESAEAKATTALALLKDIQQSVARLELAPPIPEVRRTRYGTFYDTTTQTAAAINTAYPITFNSTDLSLGVYRGATTSRIYVDTVGIYNFQFSIQLDKTAGGIGLIFIWARVNGVDVPNSATQIRIQGNNAEIVAAWNFVLSLNAGDYFELVWSTDDITCQMSSSAAAAPVPAIPSVILTVTDNISIN